MIGYNKTSAMRLEFIGNHAQGTKGRHPMLGDQHALDPQLLATKLQSLYPAPYSLRKQNPDLRKGQDTKVRTLLACGSGIS